MNDPFVDYSEESLGTATVVDPDAASNIGTYVGTFLIGFTSLAFEVTLTRLLSVITWYHLAFFAVSVAMLGMTAGATTIYLRPNWSTRLNLVGNLTRSSLALSFSLPLSLTLLCLLPLGVASATMDLLAIVFATAASALPFYFSGVALTLALTRHHLPTARVYASDLLGASLGCLFVLGGLEILDAPSLILICGGMAALAALAFGSSSRSFPHRRLSLSLVALFLVLGYLNSQYPGGLRPLFVKGNLQASNDYLLEEWNSFSRVVVGQKTHGKPIYWGPSPLAPSDKMIEQHLMLIDGEAGTIVRRFQSVEDIDDLRFDVTNIAYFLRPKGKACVIGVGGGKDVLSAILFGHEEVLGIDVNPVFINLLRHQFRDFAGLADRKGVTMVADEARSYLTRIPDKFSTIQMSLIDTWAATGAGAFSLSENALYTIEAWQVFFERLSDDGIFTVSRWYNPDDLGETGRVVSLAVASLLRAGVTTPHRNVAMVTSAQVSTLIVSKTPLTGQDMETLHKVAAELQYDVVISPETPPSNEVLRSLVSSDSVEELRRAIADRPYNYEPTTDENPYFFNMLRLSHLELAGAGKGVLRGNLIATMTLLFLIITLAGLAAVAIILPLAISARHRPAGSSLRIAWSTALYFSLIGAGFMCIEIALIQRLSVFLGHPIYGLGILLFTIIASTGIGSFVSERLPLNRRPWVVAFPLLTAAGVIAIRFLLTILMTNLISAPLLTRVLASIAVIFPLGVALGFFFAVGMNISKSRGDANTPWYFALNGIFGVLFSALAVFFSIYFGIQTNFYIGSSCYALVALCLWRMSLPPQGRLSTER